jgi:hypothetical protein
MCICEIRRAAPCCSGVSPFRLCQALHFLPSKLISPSLTKTSPLFFLPLTRCGGGGGTGAGRGPKAQLEEHAHPTTQMRLNLELQKKSQGNQPQGQSGQNWLAPQICRHMIGLRRRGGRRTRGRRKGHMGSIQEE